MKGQPLILAQANIVCNAIEYFHILRYILFVEEVSDVDQPDVEDSDDEVSETNEKSENKPESK